MPMISNFFIYMRPNLLITPAGDVLLSVPEVVYSRGNVACYIF